MPKPRRGIIAIFAIACLAPYPTQVAPAVSLQVVDQNGVGIGDLIVIWEGGFYADWYSTRGITDGNGAVILPRHVVWMSPVTRLLSALGCFLPHSGFRSVGARGYFYVPGEYSFDASMVGDPPGSGSGATLSPMRSWAEAWGIRHVEMHGIGDTLSFESTHPAGPAASIHIVLSRHAVNVPLDQK